MAAPMLKSIQPSNLLSFGPETEPIELRPLNILIGANGSGKSNLIEVLRLLFLLPDKEPWRVVLATGGVDEWLWKGSKRAAPKCSLTAVLSLFETDTRLIAGTPKDHRISIELERLDSSFRVRREVIGVVAQSATYDDLENRFEREGSFAYVQLRAARINGSPTPFHVNPERSVLSQLSSPSVLAGVMGDIPELPEIAQFFESFDFHQDWDFGVDCPPRDPVPVGQSVARLEEDARNLAQMLAHYRDNHKAVFEELTGMVKRFYEPTKSVEIRNVITHLQIFIEEEGGFSTPATRLSDGMLRWLALMTILLNPDPAPVTCIDEPELGLHPDVIPALADLLREASSRTQLIVTTHSPILVDAFSNDPESVCVAEKIKGSTVIRRLSQSDLSVWLKDYSLGTLWTSGEIGGNRW